MQQYSKTYIREIFTSIQGEGPYVGEKQTFIRFCKCNLKCDFCDTDFDFKNAKEYSTKELFNYLENNSCETISLTGGEPLLDVKFLKELFSFKLNKKIYLETNGTCFNELSEIIDFVDVVSMDIKLNSATNQINQFDLNEKFLEIANKKETYIKVVFDKNIANDEIENVINLAKKHNNLVVLQPKMPMDKDLDFGDIFNRFYQKYKNVRLIPQVHKFLNVI